MLLEQRRRKNRQRETNEDDSSDHRDEDTPATMNRNYLDHYNQVLRLCVAIRMLANRTITRQQAQDAQSLLERVCITYIRMGAHLTPNFHYAMHTLMWIEMFGPMYAWWVWSYERANGLLKRVNINCHRAGELEGTLMRSWWKVITLQELVRLPRSEKQNLLDHITRLHNYKHYQTKLSKTTNVSKHF